MESWESAGEMTGREDSEREGNGRSRRCVGRERRQEHGSGGREREGDEASDKKVVLFSYPSGRDSQSAFVPAGLVRLG